jgi:hypothetical protein
MQGLLKQCNLPSNTESFGVLYFAGEFSGTLSDFALAGLTGLLQCGQTRLSVVLLSELLPVFATIELSDSILL